MHTKASQLELAVDVDCRTVACFCLGNTSNQCLLFLTDNSKLERQLTRPEVMGKTRGHGSRRGAYRGGRGGSKGRAGDEDEDSSEEEYEQPRGLGEGVLLQKISLVAHQPRHGFASSHAYG